MIEINPTEHEGIMKLIMCNDQLEIEVTNYGCTILRILMPDRFDTIGDIVLGYDTIREYQTQDGYLGATIGRVANRIKKGKFSLHGKLYQLVVNNSPHHLHGGLQGFSHKVFDYQVLNDHSIIFTYVSDDMEEGYPGRLTLYVTYTLLKNVLEIKYSATTTKDTIINITNHTYFNLTCGEQNILQHYLKVTSDKIACIDCDGLPTGILLEVKDTPFDFRKLAKIDTGIHQKHEQILFGKGYDHPFIFHEKEKQVVLLEKSSGRKVTVLTTLPGVQIYTGNILSRRMGKNRSYYDKFGGICIETQYLPDAINIEKQPSTILKKEDIYEAITNYTFDVIK